MRTSTYSQDCLDAIVEQERILRYDKTFTSHPNSREELPAGKWVDQPVVRDGNILTSQAPGTAFAFALALVEILDSPETARKVAGGMQYRA